MVTNTPSYNSISMYLTTAKSIEDIAAEVGEDKENFSDEIRRLYSACVRAYEIHLNEDVTQGKAAELAGVNKSVFVLFLAKYALPSDDDNVGKQKLQELKQDKLYQPSSA